MKLQKLGKNLAIILLSVVLVVCGLVFFFMQNNNSTNDAIANGGSQGGSTLVNGTELTADLINENGGTLYGGEYYLGGDVTLTTYNIRTSGKVTLDLNGYTLTGNGSGSIVYIAAGTVFVLNDSVGTGKLTGGNATTNNNNKGAAVTVQGQFIMNGGTITGNTAPLNPDVSEAIYSYATVEINGGSIIGSGTGYIWRQGSNTTAVINGGTLTGGKIKFYTSSTTTMTINGGHINIDSFWGDGTGAYTATINGGYLDLTNALTGTANGKFEINGGYLNLPTGVAGTTNTNFEINGGYFSAANVGEQKVTASNLSVAESSVVVDLNGTVFDPDFNYNYRYAVYKSVGTDVAITPIGSAETLTFKYTGTVISPELIFTIANGLDVKYLRSTSQSLVMVSPGSYTLKANDKVFVYLKDMGVGAPKEYATTKLASNLVVTITNDDTPIDTVLTADLINKNQGILPVGNYKLISDVQLTSYNIIIMSGKVTLDLNGYTLTGNGLGTIISVWPDGEFVLNDSSASGTGTITGGIGAMYTNGKVVMNGGNLVGNKFNGAYTASADGIALGNEATAVLEMNGGLVSAEEGQSAIRAAIKSKATINGGTVEGIIYYNDYQATTLTINGGYINGKIEQGNGVGGLNLTINGGYFKETITTSRLGWTPTINGGYFKTASIEEKTVLDVAFPVAESRIIINLTGTTFDPAFNSSYPYAVYVDKGTDVQLMPKNGGVTQNFTYTGVALTGADIFSSYGELDGQYIVVRNNVDLMLLPKTYTFTSNATDKFVYFKDNGLGQAKEYASTKIAKDFTVIINTNSEEVTLTLTTDLVNNNKGILFTGNYVLSDNVQLNDYGITIKQGKVTLDLNGYTLTGNRRQLVINVYNGAEFTLNDSSIDGTGTITGGNGAINASGKVVMNGGNLVGNPYNGAYTAVADGVTVGNYASASFEMNGGLIQAEEGKSAIRVAILSSTTINAGTINGIIHCNDYGPTQQVKLTINGGNINGVIQQANVQGGLILTINGGYINAPLTTAKEEWNQITINGGYFAYGDVSQNSVLGFAVSSNRVVYKLTSDVMDSAYNVDCPYAVYNNAGSVGMSANNTISSTVYDAQVLDITDFGLEVKYNGELQTAIDAAFSYKKAEGELTQGLPTDAGNYTITATAYYLVKTEDGAYLYNVVKQFSYTVNPKTVDVVWSNTSVVYNAQTQLPTAMADELESGTVVTVDAQGYVVDAKDAGTYTAKVTFASGNYVASAETATTEFEITPASLTVEWNTDGLVYTGSEVKPTAKLNGVIDGGEVNAIVTVLKGGINVRDESQAEVTLDSTNYVLTGDNLVVDYKITPKTLIDSMFEAIPDQMWTGKQITPTLVPADNEPIVLGSDYKVEYGTNLDTTGKVTVTVVDGGNYTLGEGTSEIVLTFTITTNLSEMTITISDVVYTGTNVRPNIIISGVEYTPEQLAAMNLQLVWANDVNISKPESKASVTITPTGSSSFTGSLKGEFSIVPIELKIVWGDVLTHVYDGTSFIPTYSVVGLLDGGLKLDFTMSEAQVNAGDYEAVLELLTVLPEYYTMDEESLRQAYSITARSLNVVWVKDFVYDGQEHFPTATTDTGIAGMTVELTIDGQAQRNAGKYAVEAKLDNKNFVLVGAETEFVITPKTITVEWSNTEFVYNGQLFAPTATVETGIANELVVLTVYGASKEVGTHKATASMIVANSNYKLANNTTEFTIKASTLVTGDSNVTVEGSNGFNPDWTLSATAGDVSSVKVPEGQVALAVYDITLNSNGVAQQPDGKIKVSIKLTEEQLKSEYLRVYYIDENGQAQYVASSLNGDSIVFEVDHLSTYAITTAAPATPYAMIFAIVFGVLALGFMIALIAVLAAKKPRKVTKA